MKRFALLFTLLACASAALAQQNYPSRPLRMVIPWPPGQATDLAGRLVALKLTELLQQQVVSDNRPGAGGMIGTDVVAKAAPDGYTLLAASSGPISIAPLVQKAPYDYERELAPVANVAFSPFVLVTGPTFPAKNASELVALVKSNPGKYTYSSSGTGASAHLAVEWFNNMNGLKATHVPYKGSVPALLDVSSGQVAYGLETVAATMPHVRAGRLKAHGVSTARVTTLAPELQPLATAAGIPGYDFSAWIGVMVAAGTPQPLVKRLTAAVDEAMKAPDMRERLAGAGLEVDYRPTADFSRHLKGQKERFSDIIRKANIKVE
jgi:tripartite-type tricarboxylate transporter receptor subunit TctC